MVIDTSCRTTENAVLIRLKNGFHSIDNVFKIIQRCFMNKVQFNFVKCYETCLQLPKTNIGINLLFKGGTSFLDHLCCLFFVFVMLSCLFFAVLWSAAGKGLTTWLLFLMFLSLSHVVSWIRCGTYFQLEATIGNVLEKRGNITEFQIYFDLQHMVCGKTGCNTKGYKLFYSIFEVYHGKLLRSQLNEGSQRQIILRVV